MSDKKRVLIIEDEASLVHALEEKLSSAGYQPLIAENGQLGLDRALSEHPDCILLDIVMPVMDGITMLKKLRKDPWGADVPVLILTNLDDTKKMEERLKYNAFDYLVKTDWGPDDVVKQVGLMLKKSPGN